MGMYTELIFDATLKKDTPEEVINILKYMISDDLNNIPKIPKHDFFKATRWKYLFKSPAYLRKLWFNDDLKTWIISARSNIKNYDSEIEKFLDWIKPYIECGSGSRDFYAIVLYQFIQNKKIIIEIKKYMKLNYNYGYC